MYDGDGIKKIPQELVVDLVLGRSHVEDESYTRGSDL